MEHSSNINKTMLLFVSDEQDVLCFKIRIDDTYRRLFLVGSE